MSEHTPGPWFYEEDGYSWMLFGGSGVMPMQLAKCPKKGSPYAEYWPEEADANLIAAAPDLYEAAKKVWERRPFDSSEPYSPFSQALLGLRDALAKVERKDK